MISRMESEGTEQARQSFTEYEMRIKNKLLAIGCIAAAAGSLVSGLACNAHDIELFSSSLVAGKKQLSGSGNVRAVDILFVIDNSNSMAEEQKDLDTNFTIFVDRLIAAGANFRIGVVTTDDLNTLAEKATFSTMSAFDSDFFEKNYPDEKEDFRERCANYYTDGKHAWIQSEDIAKYVSENASNEEKSAWVRDMFRCSAMVGTNGHQIERGLSTMWKGLATYLGTSVTDTNRFKRPGSILSIVFVTDENDCSDSMVSDGYATLADGITLATSESILGSQSGHTKVCENERNIEDSCTITKRDAISYTSTDGSFIETAGGQPIEFTYQTIDNNGTLVTHQEKRLLREWCVQGDETARKALCKCLKDHEAYLANPDDAEDCPAAVNIEYKAENCANDFTSPKRLVPRSYYFEKVLNYVIESNRMEYQKTRPDFATMTPREFDKEVRELAKADVIVANIINRDQGLRYDKVFPETWCGSAGNQGYRYQLFAEMFNNDPIYAPICCKNEQFMTAGTNTGGASSIVCEAGSNGTNAQFGPVLGVIGTRIGEAVNTICTESAPLTCRIEDCNEATADGYDPTKPRANPGAACGCLRGCNGTKAYLANSDREYYLCNEFQVAIGTVDAGKPLVEENVEYLTEGSEYKVDYESNYCYVRTGSPIQINLSKNDASKTLIIEYPKKVAGN